MHLAGITRRIAAAYLAGTMLLPTLAPAADEEPADRNPEKRTITQSWVQEENYQRPYWVHVPEHETGSEENAWPVLIFLHGNGGDAQRAMGGFLRRHPAIASQFITVFPAGYQKSWNIVSERSKADDLKFVEAIIEELGRRDDVRGDQISIMGVSNGAALANQVAIESQLPNIKNLITAVSPLNGFQHDGTNFKVRGADNGYRESASPKKGRRLLNISGTQDRLVPYQGGPSSAIRAKDGKLPFIHAEESIFLWAKQLGYSGEKLAGPSRVDGAIETFSYLDGDVVHLKVNDRGHNATGAISERVLLEFLTGGSD